MLYKLLYVYVLLDVGICSLAMITLCTVNANTLIGASSHLVFRLSLHIMSKLPRTQNNFMKIKVATIMSFCYFVPLHNTTKYNNELVLYIGIMLSSMKILFSTTSKANIEEEKREIVYYVHLE